MVNARQGSGSSPVETGSTAVAPSLVRFAGPDVGRAVTFHLLDAGLARRVRPQSVQKTVARLTRSSICLTMNKDQWGDMTDPQRLQWLLDESRTTVELTDDDTAILRAADDE